MLTLLIFISFTTSLPRPIKLPTFTVALLRTIGAHFFSCCCSSSSCLAEQPRAPEEGHGLNRAFPQCPQRVYVVLLVSVVVCIAVFNNVFNSMGCCVASWTGISNGSIQPLLVCQKVLEWRCLRHGTNPQSCQGRKLWGPNCHNTPPTPTRGRESLGTASVTRAIPSLL
ncbi:hypothetical protein Pmani_002358 [Petrolisthes manimaculis]|uniref:Uncharacterized protein n=1 Tax=Petrolisthes manimaculis TaxID=1843537 RepID=A0AAE1QHN2_9EUCA|nr:hypothetical protein Pmani_002358 [Petrolisthes manimaculis]